MTAPDDLVPCKQCQRGIYRSQLEANDGLCGDCKPVNADAPKRPKPVSPSEP